MKPSSSRRLFETYSPVVRMTTPVASIFIDEDMEDVAKLCWSPSSTTSSQSAPSPLSSPMASNHLNSCEPLQVVSECHQNTKHDIQIDHIPSNVIEHRLCTPLQPLTASTNSIVDFISHFNAIALQSMYLHNHTSTEPAPSTSSSTSSSSYYRMHDQTYDSAVMMSSLCDPDWQAGAIPVSVRNYSMELENAIENDTLSYQNDAKFLIPTEEGETVINFPSPHMQKRPAGYVSTIYKTVTPPPISSHPRDEKMTLRQENLKRGRQGDTSYESTGDRKRQKKVANSSVSVSQSKRELTKLTMKTKAKLSGINSSQMQNSISKSKSGKFESETDRSHLYHSPMLVPGRRSKLPLRVITHLRHFFLENIRHPYPNDAQKLTLAHETKLTVKQISDWFTNNRKRYYRSYERYLSNVKCQLAAKKKNNCECAGVNNPPIHNWRMMWD